MTNTTVTINDKISLGLNNTDIIEVVARQLPLQGFGVSIETYPRINLSMSNAMIEKLIEDLTELIEPWRQLKK